MEHAKARWNFSVMMYPHQSMNIRNPFTIPKFSMGFTEALIVCGPGKNEAPVPPLNLLHETINDGTGLRASLTSGQLSHQSLRN